MMLRMCATVCGLVLATCSDVQAQPSYVFTRIADTVSSPEAGLDGVGCVGLSNKGTVIVVGGRGRIWRGNGQPGSWSPLPPENLPPPCPSINNNDEIAHYVAAPQLGHFTLVRNSAGILTPLAHSTASPYLDASTRTYLPSLSDSGHSAFYAGGGPGPGTGAGLYIGPGGIPVSTSVSHPHLSAHLFASINEALDVPFMAMNSITARWGLYVNSGVPFVEDGGAVITNLFLQRPVINNAGVIAFVGRHADGRVGVFKTTDGSSFTYVGSGATQGGHDRISLNDRGEVAFDATASAGHNEILYVGSGSGSAKAVIGQGDALDGSIAQQLFMWHESLNDHGQLAFYAMLADGRRGVYRADPQWLASVSFTQSVTSCGPLTGKVKLAAKAPAGGLVIELASTNPAASLPATVTVPAGKTSVSFPITLTAVLASTAGDITVSTGGQSRTRTLTVRPITVKTLTIAPNPVVGGNPVSGTVDLECAAPHDIEVALSSKTPAIAQPGSPTLLVPAGTPSQTFPIATTAVAAPRKVSIKASAYGTTKSKALTVNP